MTISCAMSKTTAYQSVVAAAYYEPVPAPVAIYQGEPIRQDVIVNDENAVIVDDDPDVVVLRRPPTTSDGRY